MDNLDQLQLKLDKILNPSMPEPVAIPEVKAQPINPMFYQIAAGMGNNDGAASMSPVEKDLRTLTPNQLYAKYGQQQADEMLGQLALASGELQRGNLAERDWGETAWDSTTGIANAFVGGLGSIAAYGAGKVNADAGVALSDAVGNLRKFTEENQSDPLNARRRVGAIKDSLTQRDSDAQYDFDIQNGNSKTEAGFDQFFRDIGNSSVFDDSTLLAQGVADAIGSFATAYPVGAAIKGVARVLVPKATARGIGLSGAMDAELGKWTVNRALSNADKLVWPAAIGTLESGGTYQQTVEDATNTLKQQGQTTGDKSSLINDTAQQAADRMFLPAAGLGTITRFGEKPFHVPNVKTAATNILGRELPEEAGQGALGTVLSNQAIQDKIDPNRKLVQGVGEATVQGAVYGSFAAGTVQAPGLAKQSVISAAKATLGYVDKRTALAAEKADDASPVGTKALKEKASTLVPNAEPVKQTLAAELAGTELPDEEKDQGIKYANDLVDSLRVSVENEFDDTIPPELSSIISGSEHRIDAIQQLAKKVITTSDPNEKFLTAATLYQLLQPILDLQTNRPSSVDNLSPESQAVLKDYESLIANVNNSPTIKNAMKQIHDIMVAQGATVLSPITEQDFSVSATNTDAKLLARKRELQAQLVKINSDWVEEFANSEGDDLVLTPDTRAIDDELAKINSQLQGGSSTLSPAGKNKVNAIITAANIAPDQGNLDATESIMKHAKEGKLTLTPEQTTTLNTSVALLRARKELEEKNKQFGLNATDIVSSEILTDRGVKDNNARSATQYTQEILSAVRRGNTLGATQLLYDMGLFVKHMKNKVEAINKHYLSGDTSKGSYVPYKALLPATRQWVNSETNPKALYKGGFVNVASPESIKFVQGVELEHKILADVFNSLTEVFPDLGIDRIEPLQLEKGISGAVRITNQEPTKPVVKEEPKPKVTEPEVKVVEPKVEDNPVTEISSNAKGLAAALTNPTELSKSKGNITKSYPVNFNGKTYRDAEEAYQKLKHLATKDSGPNSTYNLMVDIIKAKLEQHPSLVSEITKQGGSGWILSSIHQPTKQNTIWETGGKNWFIKALNEAYLSQIKPIQKEQVKEPIVENKVQEKPTDKPVVTEGNKQAPETVEGLVKEYGYLGELLADEDVAKVVKDVIETVLEVKAGEKRLTSYSRFVGLFAVHGYIEYFTKQAKSDPNIIKLTKAANKLRNLVRLTQHINFLEDYVDSQNNDDLRAYLNKYPELKSIFSELKVKNPTKGTRSLALDVIADFTRVKNLITTELGKLVQLVGLMYIQAAFEKGQQYLRDTNYADLNEVLSPTVLALLKGENIGVLAKNKVLGDDAAVRRNSITDVELTFLDKIDGIPVGELSKEDFETVKALVQNAVNAGFNSYKVVNYTRNEEKISSDIVHNIIVEHLPKEGFALETFTPEQVINGAVPESFIWDFEKKTPETTENTGKATPVEVKPEPVTFTGKMTFSYGSNKRSDVESDTTFNAIKAGERTATTRYTTDGKIDYWSKAKVGDIIEFSNKDGDIVRVEVTKPLTKLPLNTDGETWSKKEGWSIDYFNKNVKPKLDKAYQLEYKLIGKAEPKKTKTPEPTPPVVSEPILEEVKPPKAFELNDGQKAAFDKIMSFLDSSGITFTLTGSAGTGKTTLVNTIIAALKKANSVYGSVVLSAPTHRANAVTKSKNKDQKVMTLHQLLSLAPEVDLENFDASKVKFNQIEKEKDPFPKSGLIIIDESSMISDALYNFLMDKVSEFPDVKILFLGDAAQLRPVTKDNKSSLHDSKALTQTDGQANLTKVERAKNPELLDESINLREKGSFTNNNNMKNSNGVAFTNSEAGFINRLIRMFKSQEFADNRLLVRAVAYTNKRVTEINTKVRESLYGKDAPDYVVGDLLMGYNRFGKQDDKGNLPIANGIDYLVTSVGSEKTIDILGVQVRTASITIKDVYGLGGSNTLTVILPSNDAAVWQSLGEKFQKLSTQAYAARDKSIFDQEASKYVFPRDLKALVTPRNTSIKPFETTLIKQTINYGYAHTIHKSQGGTYTYVFVDEPSILSTKDLDTRKRLRYVGMTRAEKGAYILTTSEITGEPITEAKFPVATSVTDLKDTPVKQEPIPVEQVVAKEVPVKQEEPVTDTTLDNELPTENTTVVENSPIVTGNKNAVIKVKADTVVPSKLSNLVQGAANFFINSFKFKGKETTRTDDVESPLEFVEKALLDSSSFQEAVPNSNYEMNKTVAKAYRGYLGQYYDELSNKLTDNLKLFFSENKRLARFEKGESLNRYEEGKVLNITERTDKGYQYNQHLLELATLAGLQWFLTAGQTERRVDIEDVAQLLGITEDKITDELMNQFLNTSDMGQLSQGLTNTIKSFWGISGISTEMMAYTDGIPEAMAAEVIRAFTELEMITLTKVDHPTKPGQGVNRYEVNRFDNDALYSFPTAIQEVVLVESDDVTYFGDDIPPVPQTQLGNPTIKLSRKEKKAVAAANKTEVKTNVLQANIIMSLTQDALKVMFGGGIENEHMNKNTLASIQGENKTILNAYQAMVDMLSRVDNVSKTLGKDASEVVMRFPHTITKVGRLMMLGKYNIQSSKLLREVFLPTWSTLDLQNNQDHIDAFHLAVSQALGIKVHNEGPESIKKLRVLLSGKLAPAITLVQEWMEATDNGENPIAFNGLKLAQIFKDAGEGLTPNAFHALIEYVRYQRTEDKTKFTTGLYLEADGVTNGPGNAIQMLTLGKFTGNWVTTVEKIGHSFGEPKAKHELDKNNKDLYGTAGVASVAPLQAIISKIRQSPDKEEIMGILGSLYSLMSTTVEGIKYDPSNLETTGGVDANRSFFKNPLTILLYGSGITGIAGKATKQMVDSIYKRFSDANILLNSKEGKNLTVAQAIFPGDENAEQTYKKFVEDLNRIRSTTINTEYIDRKKVYVVEGVNQPVRKYGKPELQDFTFTGSEVDAITQNITKGLVEAMHQGAVETVGHSVMQSTQMIQMATQIQSILLEAAFTKAVRDKIKNYKSLDPEYRAGDFISKQDFMDIMEELKAIAPYLRTGDQTFLAAKSKRYRNETDSKVEYSRSLNDMFRTEPNMYIPTNAGVSGTPNLVIGMGDAYAILQATIDESLVGNLWIYDGINMPLDKILDYAPKLNKAAFEAWQNNPLRVLEESFRSFMGEKSIMIKALNETLNNEDLANQLNNSLRLYKEEDKLVRGSTDYALSIFNDLLNELKDSADSIDARHAAIARMANSVDQLAAAGVPYHNGVAVDPTLDTPEKIAEQLNKYYQEELDKIKNKPKAEPVKQMTPAEMDPITKDMLNTAYHHSSGVKILNAEGLANLGRSINLSREQKIGFLQIIRAKTLDGYAVIFGSVDQIKEYRKQSKYSDISLDQETDNGFIDLKTKTIYLINPSVETLVHEMIHAATYGSVLNYYQNPSLNTKEVNDAIKRTEGLLEEFLNLSERELARLTPDQRAAINNVKAAIQEPGNDLDNTSDVALAKSLNEFMAWSLSNQELIATFKNVKIPTALRIAQEVIAIIKKFFTFKDKATGETKEQDLTIPKDLFGNLLFNASVIINSAQPSLAETMADTTLFHSGTAKHITQLRETLIDKVALFLDKSGQAFNVALYNSGFAKVLTEAADTVNSLVPIFGLSSIEQSTLHHVVAALSAEIQVDPLTIDGIQTLYAHTVVELAKQVDAGTYPKAKYDALIGRIGNPKIINGKSTLLPVFLGLGLIDTELRDALAKIDMPTKTKNTTGTLNGGLENQANKMLDGLFKVLTGQRKAHDVSDALELLTERLTEIALKEDSAAKSVFNKPGINTDKVNEWVTDNIAVAADKGIALGKKLETSQYLAVKRLGSAITILSMMATDKNGETVARGAITMANKGNVWKPFRSLLTDFVDRSDSNAETYDLIKKVRAAVQQMRQTFRDKVPKIIAQKFTRPLDKKEWASLFRSMAKTDLSVLMDILSKKEIMEIFSNPSSLNKHISMLETRIQNQDKTNWSLYQAKMKQLAKFMNTGVTGSNLLRNPYAIHSLLNETKPKGFQTMGRDAIHDIDQLTTLYAIQSLSQEDKAIMSDMVNEQAEGLEFIIDYLVGQNVTEITKLSTNPAVQMNYYKGHIPQINQSGASLIVAEDVNRADLLLQGYTRVGDYFGSNLDTNRLDKGYYFTDVSAKGSVAQGTIQNIQRTILGVDDFYGFTVGSNDRITDPIVVASITKRISRENVGIENLMPVFNDKGAVIAYERSMTPEKMALLKPSEHLAEMIGVWRGRQLEEQLAQEINEEVIDKHYDMYLKDIANSPSSQKEYVDVLDKKQLDVVEQDMVSLFSIDTIRYMANKNNGKFYVRKDVLDDMIGYRKASVSDIFTGKTRMNKPLQDAIRKVLISTFGVSAYRKAVKTERFLQNVVGEARTLIVVKSLVVPMFNIVSNIVQLVARGVPIATIVKSSPTKLLELRSYTMSQVKQVELEAEHRAASGDLRRQQVLESQIQAIKDGHKRLSIWPLIEAGEFSTISDIGNNSEDIDLFSGNTESWLDKQVSKLPANAQTVAKYGMVARDTALFQGLQKMVQYGDFIAKAVMYDDLIKRKGLTKEQALGKITDEFVNYDKLPGRARGYLEDTGLLWFYNYKLRITKIALSMMRNNPLHLLLAHAAPIPLGAGIATEDNFITKLLDGSLTRSIGPGMVVGAPLLNPWYNAMN